MWPRELIYGMQFFLNYTKATSIKILKIIKRISLANDNSPTFLKNCFISPTYHEGNQQEPQNY